MFLSGFDLKGMRFKYLGKNVKISSKVSFYSPQNISIGDNVRIDDYCVLSGGSGLVIGSYIHIAVHCSFFAGSGIELQDFSGVGAYSLLLSESDDYTGRSLTGPQIPMKYKPDYKKGKIILEKYTCLGARTTIMPGVTMCEGSVTGAHTLITKDCDPWWIYVGVPAKKLKEREDDMVRLAADFLEGR